MVSENVPRVAISAGRSNFSTISTARSSGTFSNVFDQAIIRSPASSIEMLFSDYLREKSCVTQKHPKAAWFLGQALECVVLAPRTKDARIKRLHALEAARWLRLAELKRRPAESDSGPIAAE
jgi:hypothetical protein